ncbi:TadE/TadG family type IV pilus assembly protein [Devosia riboflavina]
MSRWRLKSLARDTRGATMIEFAILAPIFFAILTAILQTSVQFFAAQVLESGMSDASRAIRVGQAQHDGWTVDDYKNNVCDRLYGLFGNCADMHVTVRQINDFQSADYSIPLDLTCKKDCDWTEDEVWVPGGSSSVVLVQVHYRYPAILQFPYSPNMLADGRSLLSAATVFRNEPF